jgi:hypothetical protein
MQNIKTYNDLINNNLKFLNGEVKETEYHAGPVDEETLPHVKILYEINKHGLLTVCSQPGFLMKNGTRQKPFIDFYCDKEWIDIFHKLEQNNYQMIATDNLGNIVHKTKNMRLPDVVTTVNNVGRTFMPTIESIHNAFHEILDENTHLIQDKILVHMYYPKFWDKPIFKDLLKEVTLYSYKLGMICEIKDNCKVLAFIGNMGVGKDYISNEIIKLGFADALKIDAVSEHNMNPNKVFGKRDKETRTFMQEYGSSSRKNNCNIWLDKLLVSIYMQYKNNNIKKFIITDCRYKNEYNFLRSIMNENNIYMIKAEGRTKRRKLEEHVENVVHSSEELSWTSDLGIKTIHNDYDFQLDITQINY